MSLQALVFCADEKVVRVLRRVLSELEIGMELCPDAESAIHKLTRRRFEAVIVDCADPRTASRVLRSARSAPCNKRAVAVAIVGVGECVCDGVGVGTVGVTVAVCVGVRACVAPGHVMQDAVEERPI